MAFAEADALVAGALEPPVLPPPPLEERPQPATATVRTAPSAMGIEAR
ncbi:MAG TPA: hypothetical protein VHX15_01235 [Frankiaceae bacterium]|nr:hypothetical protein [Frankiaceae bacterium]